jgi:hypothetical protein
MWVLIISLYLLQPLGQIQSKGIIHAPQSDYETCLKTRDIVNKNWYLDGYRTSARCTYVKHYSTHNGAYNENH